MPTHPPYPTAGSAAGLLDCRATLQEVTLAAIPAGVDLPPLTHLLLADRLAALYEMVFPDRSTWLDEEIADWTAEDKVVAAVEQFLGRVSALFPVHNECWESELELIEWRLDEIPVAPFGFDFWHEEWEEFSEPIPYLLHLFFSRPHEVHHYRLNSFADLYPDHQVPLALAPHRLVDILRQMGAGENSGVPISAPLDALPDLIEMLAQQTGNPWLDVSEMALAEGGGFPQWQREEVEWLAEAWQEAEPVLARVNDLLDWQNGSPEAIADKLTAVRDVLLDAYNRSQQAEEITIEVKP